MKTFIVRWNIGYGDNFEEVEAANNEDALEIAEGLWNDDVQANADYGVVGEATDELRENYL